MKYSFHPLAKMELNEAAMYYEGCRTGLGIEFLEEVFSTVERIIQFPEAWSLLSRRTRRCLVNRFPYGVIYQVASNGVFIVAVMQMNREPAYWKNRIQ